MFVFMCLFRYPFWSPLCEVCIDVFAWLHHVPEKTVQKILKDISSGKCTTQLRREKYTPVKDNITAFCNSYIDGNAEPMPVDVRRDDEGRECHLIQQLHLEDEEDSTTDMLAARQEPENIRLELKKPRWADIFQEYKVMLDGDQSVPSEEIGTLF